MVVLPLLLAQVASAGIFSDLHKRIVSVHTLVRGGDLGPVEF